MHTEVLIPARRLQRDGIITNLTKENYYSAQVKKKKEGKKITYISLRRSDEEVAVLTVLIE